MTFWDGTRWVHMGSPSLGTTSILLSVAATSSRNAWAVGDFTASGLSQSLALHCC